jgi:hypothetical protein
LPAAEQDFTRALESYDRREYAAHRPLALYELAQVQARLGKKSAALASLERALAEGYAPTGSAPGFTKDEQLASLRSDPRFQVLVARAARRAE